MGIKLPKQLNVNSEKSPKAYAPSFEFELKFDGIVAGIDEVGIGSWVGPVMAAAVILKPEVPKDILQNLQDSKKLSATKRNFIYHQLLKCPHVIYGIGQASVDEIEALNIRQATFLAMSRAVDALGVKPDAAIVDGNARPILPCPIQMVVKGDQRSFSIAAASIIAKVTRDQFIKDLAEKFPEYGWDKNAGYGTQKHRDALNNQGVTDFHRKGYAPIARLLCSERLKN
tara:strand:+ start:14875 stop:15558 length:684 start_codon:yes stop_codon:yes gene_type:complete